MNQGIIVLPVLFIVMGYLYLEIPLVELTLHLMVLTGQIKVISPITTHLMLVFTAMDYLYLVMT